MLLLLGGLYCPTCNAIGGAMWFVSRLVYAWGYYSGGNFGGILGFGILHGLQVKVKI